MILAKSVVYGGRKKGENATVNEIRKLNDTKVGPFIVPRHIASNPSQHIGYGQYLEQWFEANLVI